MTHKRFRVGLVDGGYDFIEADSYYFANGMLRFSKILVRATLPEDDARETVAMYKDWRSVQLVDE